jgi:Tfp pilus assembly protein PilF
MSGLADWPFVARSDEQERFLTTVAGLARASNGSDSSTVVLVEGLGGYGKSWLMTRFRRLAESRRHQSPLKRLLRRSPLVVSLDWEMEDVTPTAGTSAGSGPASSLVFAKLYAALAEQTRSEWFGRRKFARCFRDFTTTLSSIPELKAAADNRPDGPQGLTSLMRVGGKMIAGGTGVGPYVDPAVNILADAIREDAARLRIGDRITAAVRGKQTLVRTFAEGLRELSQRRPVILLLDTCEVIGSAIHELRGASLQAGPRVIWVLAGRFEAESPEGESGEAAAFRRELPEGTVRVIPMTTFDDETVRQLVRLAEAPLTPDEEVAAVSLTRGIPLAVFLVAKMLSHGLRIAEVIAPIDTAGDSTELVRGLAERYLKHVRKDPLLSPDEHRLYCLALLHGDHRDPEVLRALWDEPGSVDVALDELAVRHDFVLTPNRRLHVEVRETIRSYLLDAVRRADIRPANERARLVLVERITNTQHRSFEAQLEDELWQKDALAFLWHSFWVDNADGLAVLADLLPAALFVRPSFARELVGVAALFFPTLTEDEQSVLRGCGGLLTFGSFVDRWLARRRATLTLRAAGPLGRLLDDQSEADRDALLQFLGQSRPPIAANALRHSPPRKSLVALLAARHSVEPALRLEHLELAVPGLPRSGPVAREVVRIGTDIRDSLRREAANGHRNEDLYVRAASVDAGFESEFDDANSLGNYAVFLSTVWGDHDRAEELYERAIAAEPEHANNLNNYAVFLKTSRGDLEGAEKLYERAMAADPEHANTLGNYAIFLETVRDDRERAEELFERAIAADPEHANNLGAYALFLKRVRRDHDRAEELFERAIAADPEHAHNLGNYAIFLTDVRRDHDRAEELFERAIAADPEHANNLGNYARLLLERGDDARALELIRQSFLHAGERDDPLRAELWLYLGALGPEDGRDHALASLAALLERGVRSPGWEVCRVLARARAQDHTDIARVEELAEVLSSHRGH